jgi:hypothetical protein
LVDLVAGVDADPEVVDLDPESDEDADDSDEDDFALESDAAGLASLVEVVPASAGLLSEELLTAFGA